MTVTDPDPIGNNSRYNNREQRVRIRVGWSGETKTNVWEKVSIELEQDDLHRIFRENDLPEGLHERLPTRVCFQLLQNEAEALLLNKLKTFGYPVDQVTARTAVLMGGSAEIISTIKQRLAAAV